MAVEIKTDLINVEGGINENYDKVIECSNGLLNVCDHMRWGYVTKDGKKITPLKYDGHADFNDGFARVKYDRGYMMLDENGVEHEI